MDIQQLGKRLRELREQAGLTQRELARRVGVNFSYLSKIEKGVVAPPSERLVERLARAARSHNHQALIEAGELMYASHWSYGQRCGLGSIETDKLVNLIRAQGNHHELFGAKISARGAGGTVVVLHADTPAARSALSQAVDQYASQTGCQPTTLNGTSPGAVRWGIRNVV